MLIIAHGGAGTKRPAKKALKKLRESLEAGLRVLKGNGSALQAVIETIAVLEDSGLFNAGKGGNLQLDGKRRLDASLMEGSTLRAGSVIGLQGFGNPVKAAEIIMSSPHRIMTNEGAAVLARAHGLKRLPAPGRAELDGLKKIKKGPVLALYKKHFSTVGAVALDKDGNVAAGSSTGGVLTMLPGRVGDTPIIGAGIYADSDTAVSCTGKGEDIIRVALAKEVSIEMGRKGPKRASTGSLKKVLKLGGEAGLIALDSSGRFVIAHTTDTMASGYADGKRVVVRDGFTRVGLTRGAYR